MGAFSHLLFPPYRLDLRNERLLRADKLIPLRAKPFALLRFMAENPGRLVLHEELRKAIWPTTYVSEGVLRVYLREVRAALEDDPEGAPLHRDHRAARLPVSARRRASYKRRQI